MKNEDFESSRKKKKRLWIYLVPFMSGKCKRIPRHLFFLLWFSWRCKFAEVFAKSTTSKENKANNDLFTFWIRGLFTSAKLHDKLLWLIGGVVCVYTSQLNGTEIHHLLFSLQFTHGYLDNVWFLRQKFSRKARNCYNSFVCLCMVTLMCG